MQPSQYDFYIASRLSNVPSWSNKRRPDLTTGGFSDGTSSDLYIADVPLEGSNFLFLDCTIVTPIHAILFYTADKAYIGYNMLSDVCNICFRVPEEAAFFSVFVNQEYQDAATLVASSAKPLFIYASQKITPNYKRLTKKYSQEEDAVFFREKLEGSITLKGQDYDLLKNATLSDRFILLIERDASLYYKGFFGITDCMVNRSYRAITLQKTTPSDGYIKVLEGLDKTFDLLKLAPAITSVRLFKRPVIQLYLAGAPTVTNYISGTYWEQEVSELILDSNALINTYHFSNVKTYYELYMKGPYILPGDYSTIILESDPQIVVSDIPALGGTLTVGQVLWEYKVSNKEIWRLKVSYIEGYIGFKAVLGLYDDTDEDYGILLESEESSFNMPDKVYSLFNFLRYWQDTSSINYPKFYELGGRYIGEALIFSQNIYRRILVDKSIKSVEDSTGVKDTYEIANTDFAVVGQNYNRVIGLPGGLYFASSATQEEPTRYGVNSVGEYFIDTFIPESQGDISKQRLIPISRTGWSNVSIWTTLTDLYSDAAGDSLLQKASKSYILTHAYSLENVLRALLKEIDPSIDTSVIASTFFSDYPARIFLAPKSNVLKAEYDQPAQKAEITLKQLFNMIATCFNCYWRINSQNQLELEQKNDFYTQTVEPDWPGAGQDQFNKKPVLYGQMEQTYDLSGLYSRLELSWSEGSTELFGPLYIDAIGEYAQGSEVKKLDPGNFAADIDYMLANPAAFSEEGFALIGATKVDNVWQVAVYETEYYTESLKQFKASVQNHYMSWPYLFRSNYLTECPTPVLSYPLNYSKKIYAFGLTPVARQSIVFPSYSDPNMEHLIKTELGTARPISSEIDIDTRQCKLELELLRDE